MENNEAKKKSCKILTVPNKINILKSSFKTKQRKKVKVKKIKSVNQLIPSLGVRKISYLDSPSGTIECVETVDRNNLTYSNSNPLTSASSSSLKDFNHGKSVKPQKHKITNQKPGNNHLLPYSIPKNSGEKIKCNTSANDFVNDKLQFTSVSRKSDSEWFSTQGEPNVSNPILLGNIESNRCIKPQKHNNVKKKSGNNCQLSRSSSKTSIVKMPCCTSDNSSGNTILHTLCSDVRKSDSGGFSLLESLMLTGNDSKDTSIEGAKIEEKLGRNEFSGSRRNNKLSLNRLEATGAQSLPLSNKEMTNRKLNDSSNSPICSLVLNSNNTNSVANFYELGCSKFIVLMKPGSNLVVVGTVEIQLLKGSIEILGYSSHKEDEKLLIFSLQGSSHLSLIAKDSHVCENKSNKILCEKLITLGLPEQLSQKVSKKAENSILFTVTRNKTDISSTVWPKFFENHSSFLIFPSTQLLCSGSRPCHIVERKIKCLFETNLEGLGLKEFNEVSEWTAIENDVLNQDYPKAVLCGGKSVGKSSLLRYLVNKCLFKWKQILVLDFDLGQCEFTAPGCISATLVEEPLLGPNYSHLKEPRRSVFLGEVDVTKCPENYIEGCKSLIDYARHTHGDIPWLINTMGFTRGFGVSLACGIINYVSPTHVIQIQSKDRKLNFPSLLEPKFVSCLKHSAFDVAGETMDYQLYAIPSGSEQPGFVSKSRGISPAESRNLVILSYMSRMLNSNTTSLSQVTPYMINMDQLDLQTTNKYNLTKAQVAAAMNGNMVALCHKMLSNQFLNCLGFGIIRGVDWQTGTIFLITPLPTTELSRVNCLVKGNVGLPDSLHYNQGDQVTGHVPYLAHTSGGTTARFARRDFRNFPVTQRDNRQYR